MFRKLSATDLLHHRATGSHPEYAEFLSTLSVGEGGRVNLTATGGSRQTHKNRLNAAAASMGIKLHYLRAGATALVFEVVAAPEAPKPPRGRRPKSAGRRHKPVR